LSKESVKDTSRKIRTGTVVSSSMDKTAVVMVGRLKKHNLYQKYIKRSKKFKIHDEKNECSVGDTVQFVETRPISKSKCFRLVEVIEKAK
jgi:small subunit ribosomal protein S17